MRQRLGAHGLAPSRARGQNFLRSEADARRIVATLDIEADDGVVEVGPGLGDLTRALAALARRVIALELDHGLVRALADAGLPAQVEVRQGDALAADFPSLGREIQPPALLVGNLPYNVAGRLITHLLLSDWTRSYRRMGFMVQAEVAERLVASPGDPGFGSLSVWAGLFSRARRALELGPDAFVPRPKVRSSFVVLDARSPAPEIADRDLLRRVVTLAFRFRRKTLRRALESLGARDAIDAALAAAGIEPRRRGETLREPELLALVRALARMPS